MLVLCAAYSGALALDCGPRAPATGFQHTHRPVLLSVLRGGADRALRSLQHPQNHLAFGAAEPRLHRWGSRRIYTHIHTYIYSVANFTLLYLNKYIQGVGKAGKSGRNARKWWGREP